MTQLSDLLSGKTQLKPIIFDRTTLEQTASCPFMAHQISINGEIMGVPAEAGQESHDVISKAISARVVENGDFQWVRDTLESGMMMSRPDVQPEVVDALKRYTYTLAQLICYDGEYERHPDDIIATGSWAPWSWKRPRTGAT